MAIQHDEDGNPYIHGDRMSKRQYFSHGGPGWDLRFWQSDYNVVTDEVDCDHPYPYGYGWSEDKEGKI